MTITLYLCGGRDSSVEGEIAYLFVVADQSKLTIFNSQVKLINAQRSLDLFGQRNVSSMQMNRHVHYLILRH
jgi:hypothetical protein